MKYYQGIPSHISIKEHIRYHTSLPVTSQGQYVIFTPYIFFLEQLEEKDTASLLPKEFLLEHLAQSQLLDASGRGGNSTSIKPSTNSPQQP